MCATPAYSQMADLGVFGDFSASTDLNRRVFRTDVFGNQVVDIWIETNHQDDRSVPFRTRMTLYRVRCDTREASAMQYVNYDRTGRVMEQHNWPLPEYQSAAPRTLREAVIASACYQN